MPTTATPAPRRTPGFSLGELTFVLLAVSVLAARTGEDGPLTDATGGGARVEDASVDGPAGVAAQGVAVEVGAHLRGFGVELDAPREQARARGVASTGAYGIVHPLRLLFFRCTPHRDLGCGEFAEPLHTATP